VELPLSLNRSDPLRQRSAIGLRYEHDQSDKDAFSSLDDWALTDLRFDSIIGSWRREQVPAAAARHCRGWLLAASAVGTGVLLALYLMVHRLGNVVTRQLSPSLQTMNSLRIWEPE